MRYSVNSVLYNRHKSRIESLSTIAEGVVPNTTAKIAASIWIGNRLISIGVCELKSDPFQAKYGRNSESIYRHAEVAAIKNALNKIRSGDLSRAILYVARVKKNKIGGEFISGLAKPCIGCQSCISDFNIKQVVYTTDEEGKFVCT